MAPYRSIQEGLILLQQDGSAVDGFNAFIGGIDNLIGFAYMIAIFGLITLAFGLLVMVGFSRASGKNKGQNNAGAYAAGAGVCVLIACTLAVGPQILVELGVPGAEAFNSINVFN